MLVAVVVTATAVIAPFAAAQDAEPVPVIPELKGKTLDEVVEIARKDVDDTPRYLRRVQGLAEDMRKNRDIVALNCVQSHLDQIKGLYRLIQAESAKMEQAIRDGRPEAEIRYHATRIVLAYNRIRDLATEAGQCIGERSGFPGTDIRVELRSDVVEYEGPLFPAIECQPAQVEVGDPVHCQSGAWDCRSPADLIGETVDVIVYVLQLFAEAFHDMDIPDPPAELTNQEPALCADGQTPAPAVLWTMESEVEVVGLTYPGADHYAQLDFTVPAGTPSGTHTISAISWVDDGDPVLVSTDIVVGSGRAGTASALPATGSNATIPLWKLGAMLVVVGGLLLRLRARAEARLALAEQAAAERWVADPDHSPSARPPRSGKRQR